MTTGNKRGPKLYGPWRGLNEWPGECGPGEVEDAWNVDFEGDVISTRGGRTKLLSTYTVLPSSVIAYGFEGSTARNDYTIEATDGDTTTTVPVGLMGTNASDALWIGFSHPVDRISFTVSTANSATATMAISYKSSRLGWRALTITDGTATSGKTLAKNGVVTWTMPTDWIGSPIPGSTLPIGVGTELYWLKITFSAALSSGTTLSALASTLSSVSATNGLYQWRRPTGERLLFVGADDKEGGFARLYVVDRFQQKFRSVSLPAQAARSGRDARWVFAPYGDSLIAANGYCFLYTDPTNPYRFKQFESQTLNVGVDEFRQNIPTQVTNLAVHNGRIFATDRATPHIVRWSLPSFQTDYLVNPSDLGGGSLWSADNYNPAYDPVGGPVTGMVSFGNSLLVLTTRGTHEIDADANSFRTVDSDVGCSAPMTVATIDSAVLFLGPGGVYAYTGTNTLLSRNVEPTIRSLNSSAITGACAAVYRKRNQYRLCVPAGSDGENNLVLVYDIARRTWTKYGLPSIQPQSGTTLHHPYEVSMIHSARDEEWGEDLLELDYDGSLWLADYGVLDDAKGIQSIVAFDRLGLEDQDTETARYLRVEHLTMGSFALSAVLLRDGDTWRRVSSNLIDTTSIGAKTLYMYEPTSADVTPTAEQLARVYNDTNEAPPTGALIGTDTWRSRRFVSSRFSFGSTGRAFQPVLLAGYDQKGATITVRGLEVETTERSGRR